MLKTTGVPSSVKRGPAAKDNRIAARYDLKTTVVYTPSSGTKRRRPTCNAMTIDASNGGIRIQTKSALLPAQIIRLEMPTHGGQTTSPTLAEVCWVTKSADGHQAGLRFLL